MEPADLIRALSEPAAYEPRPDRVDVRQTHISMVFLAGALVYKVKKPVRLAFLDYSTLEIRRHCCEEEVRLNRRLAPGVYLGVVPITREGSGLRVDGTGEVVEWAVKMERLPDQATLQAMLAGGDVDPGLIGEVGRRIAEFHARAERSDRIRELSRWENLQRIIRDNLAESSPEVGGSVSARVLERIEDLTDDVLRVHGPVLRARWERGMPCDTHGDLRPEHIYFLPGREPPGDITMVDAIEFNDAFRAMDPVADLGFLVMELIAKGRTDLARVLRDAYVSASGDHEVERLLPLFVSYRAAVRGKVGGLKSRSPEVPEADRRRARDRARGHWLVAIGALEEPAARPCLVLVIGLPGTGKSTLSRALADRASFEVLRSDQLRKEILGERPREERQPGFERGIYSPEWTDQVYEECLARAEGLLFEGRRVLVDASFRKEAWRGAFLGLAARYDVPALVFQCLADEKVVRTRLSERRGDLSDADFSIYQQAAGGWQPFSDTTARRVVEIGTGGQLDSAADAATDRLRRAGLLP